MFAASSAVSKWLVASYPIGEVLFTRTSVALLTCALFILSHTGLAVFRTQRLRHHVASQRAKPTASLSSSAEARAAHEAGGLEADTQDGGLGVGVGVEGGERNRLVRKRAVGEVTGQGGISAVCP
jgi:hypothetical protein